MPSMIRAAVGLIALLPLQGWARDPSSQWYSGLEAVEGLEQPEGLTISHYSPRSAWAELLLPCPGCFGEGANTADESLSIHFQVGSTCDLSISDVRIQSQPLPIVWDNFLTEESSRSYDSVIVEDVSGNFHSIYFSWIGFVSAPSLSLVVPGYATQTIHFSIREVDHRPISPVGFTAIMRPTAGSHRLLRLILDSTGEIIEFHDQGDEFSILDESLPTEMDDLSDDESFNLAHELESLGLLEAQAADLHTRIVSKRELISDKLRRQRNNMCLRHLIEECDGVLCKAKIVIQRIYDRLGVDTYPVGYTRLASSHYKNVNLNDHGEKSGFWNDTKEAVGESHPSNVPLMITQDGTTHALEAMELRHSQNALVWILETIAGILCLTSLWLVIKRKCASARTKAERAADREQRRNERAYRRAARRAKAHKRWDNFVDTITCGGRRSKPALHEFSEKEALPRKRWINFFTAINCFRVHVEDNKADLCDEHRALIDQDGFMEQDLDQAEKGEVLRAEIRGLQHAHEIVVSMTRPNDNRRNTHANNIPPATTISPYAPSLISTRAMSTNTLPSYTSEILPDYSSQRPSQYRRSSSSTFGSVPSLTDGGRTTPTGLGSENSGSSVINVSPRPSGETLRTRPSEDARFL